MYSTKKEWGKINLLKVNDITLGNDRANFLKLKHKNDFDKNRCLSLLLNKVESVDLIFLNPLELNNFCYSILEMMNSHSKDFSNG